MLPCEACRDQLLDHLYGLLDAADAAAVDAHLAGCPACAAARAEAARWQGLIAAAAKGSFPEATFTPPADALPTTPATIVGAGRAVTAAWSRWLVAAALLLAFAGVGGPAARDVGGYLLYKPEVDASLAAVDAALAEQGRVQTEIARAKEKAAQRVADAQTKHDAVLTEWVKAETASLEAARTRPFHVTVAGPASAIPGAPNDYVLAVADQAGKAKPVTLGAKVTDPAGKVVYTAPIPKDPITAFTLRLPANVWADAPAGTDLTLHVSATDPAGGATTEVREAVRLRDPLYTTLLTTDKPMYRPGETVYFRSLTLDRTTFTPPTRETNLRFELKAPSGQPVPGLEVVGLAKPGTQANGGFVEALRGPDGLPLRGIGSGAFALAGELAGGEYTLTCTEVPVNATHPRGVTKPVAVRKFVVNTYTPDRLDKKLEFDAKTYGPGDVVQAKFELKDQAKPLANATLTVAIDADGKAVTPDVAPTTTDANGVASIKFTLPKADEIKHAQLTVTAQSGGQVEALVRKVPLASKRLTVEFFPEGGDLVVGTECRVYLRATTTTGKPADVQGVLTDGTNDVAQVRTLTDADQPGVNQGLGAFTFTPEAGKTYTVKLDKPVGIIPPDGGYKLPAAKADGVVLHVADEVTRPGQKVRVQLRSTSVKRSVVVGAYIRGRAVAHQAATLEPNKVTDLALDFGDTKLGGVTRITVFEQPTGEKARADLKPLAERLVFRQPGETLKLSYTARRPGEDGTPTAFVPGDKVALDLAATDEQGRPTAVVLWAAVVNQSVLTMADEKTARLLPTHFLLAGEIQSPDDLEHADFLLTDHPKATQVLDLLLGTQGWRRFAEQAPDLFRRKFQGGEADHLLVASAGAGLPLGGRAFDDYWPKYEAATLALDAAERDRTAETAVADLRTELAHAEAEHQRKRDLFGNSAAELSVFADSAARRLNWLPATLVTLLGLALVFAIVWARRPAGDPVRRAFATAAVGFAAVAAVAAGSAALTGTDNDRWRGAARGLPQMDRYFRYGGRAVATAAPPAPTAAAPNGDGAVLNWNEPLDAVEAPMAAMDFAVPGPAGPDANRLGRIGEARRFALPPGPPVPPPKPGMAGDAIKDAKKDDVAKFFFKPQLQFEREDAVKLGLAAPAGPQAAGGALGGRLMDEDRDVAAVAEPFGLRAAKQEAQAFGAFGRGANPVARRMNMPRLDGELAQLEGLDRAERGRKRMMKRTASPAEDALQAVRASVPWTPPLIVREYAHARPAVSPGVEVARTDFTETLLWQPVIVTPQDGKATVTFDLSDAVSGYQVLVAGHTLGGRLGATKGTIEVRKPFNVDPKLPPEIGSADVLDVPVVLSNGTASDSSANVQLALTGLKSEGDSFAAAVAARGGVRKFVKMSPTTPEGKLAVRLTAKADGGLTDSVERTMTVVPDGFPLAGGTSDMLEKVTRAPVTLPATWLPGTLKVAVTVYPNTLSELQAGLDGLLQEPHGCFEQSSTANYPNVLIMSYLNETNTAKPDVAERARDLMDRGYGRLTGYECPKTGSETRKGFEWFGSADRPHEALTAYGVLQFTDMSRVYPVDPAMLERTKKFLLDSRDGKGGFRRNSVALDTFGRAPDHVTNAYIVWAVTEAEKAAADKSDLSKEVDALFTLASAKEGKAAKDPYFLSLVANSLLNRGRTADGITLLKAVAGMQAKDGSVAGAETSITTSSGRDLLIETTAFAVLGWLKANRADLFLAPTQAAMKWVGAQRGGGGSFGSTQATILALKALIEHARANKKPAESGELRVFVGGKEVGVKAFTTDAAGPIVVEVPDADKAFKPVATEVRVETTAKQAYPMSVAWACRTAKPNSSAACAVRAETKLARNDVTEGESVRLDVKVTNVTDAAHGMVVAIIGIPAGLKLPEDMKQLKDLTALPKDGTEPVVSYWETRGRELVLYWRGMTPKQAVSFGLDLIADVPGTYRGPASRAYLYYNADHKHWAAPLGVTVRAKAGDAVAGR